MIELYGVVREESIDNKQETVYVSIIHKDFSSALSEVKTRGNYNLVIILFMIDKISSDPYYKYRFEYVNKCNILKFYYKKDYESYLTLW